MKYPRCQVPLGPQAVKGKRTLLLLLIWPPLTPWERGGLVIAGGCRRSQLQLLSSDNAPVSMGKVASLLVDRDGSPTSLCGLYSHSGRWGGGSLPSGGMKVSNSPLSSLWHCSGWCAGLTITVPPGWNSHLPLGFSWCGWEWGHILLPGWF